MEILKDFLRPEIIIVAWKKPDITTITATNPDFESSMVTKNSSERYPDE